MSTFNHAENEKRKKTVMSSRKSIYQQSKAVVLVHGEFVDGSGWAGV
jgi:hypothetical protein